MTEPVEYVVIAAETVHLVRGVFSDRTLCGRYIPADALAGDETVSGIAATCKSCRRIFGVEAVTA